SIDEAQHALFGPTYCDTPPVNVYTDGSALGNGTPNATAGAAVYWGPNSQKNWSGRVPDSQTNNRAELYAILQALLNAPPDRTLNLYSDSEYALRSIFYWSYSHRQTGWECTNGDLLEDIILVIQWRQCPLHLRWVKAHTTTNIPNNTVDAWAK
ncbi:ribonuclease H-like protein, partial [Schizopora paradoxa]